MNLLQFLCIAAVIIKTLGELKSKKIVPEFDEDQVARIQDQWLQSEREDNHILLNALEALKNENRVLRRRLMHEAEIGSDASFKPSPRHGIVAEFPFNDFGISELNDVVDALYSINPSKWLYSAALNVKDQRRRRRMTEVAGPDSKFGEEGTITPFGEDDPIPKDGDKQMIFVISTKKVFDPLGKWYIWSLHDTILTDMVAVEPAFDFQGKHSAVIKLDLSEITSFDTAKSVVLVYKSDAYEHLIKSAEFKIRAGAVSVNQKLKDCTKTMRADTSTLFLRGTEISDFASDLPTVPKWFGVVQDAAQDLIYNIEELMNKQHSATYLSVIAPLTMRDLEPLNFATITLYLNECTLKKDIQFAEIGGWYKNDLVFDRITEISTGQGYNAVGVTDTEIADTFNRLYGPNTEYKFDGYMNLQCDYLKLPEMIFLNPSKTIRCEGKQTWTFTKLFQGAQRQLIPGIKDVSATNFFDMLFYDETFVRADSSKLYSSEELKNEIAAKYGKNVAEHIMVEELNLNSYSEIHIIHKKPAESNANCLLRISRGMGGLQNAIFCE